MSFLGAQGGIYCYKKTCGKLTCVGCYRPCGPTTLGTLKGAAIVAKRNWDTNECSTPNIRMYFKRMGLLNPDGTRTEDGERLLQTTLTSCNNKYALIKSTFPLYKGYQMKPLTQLAISMLDDFYRDTPAYLILQHLGYLDNQGEITEKGINYATKMSEKVLKYFIFRNGKRPRRRMYENAYRPRGWSRRHNLFLWEFQYAPYCKDGDLVKKAIRVISTDYIQKWLFPSLIASESVRRYRRDDGDNVFEMFKKNGDFNKHFQAVRDTGTISEQFGHMPFLSGWTV